MTPGRAAAALTLLATLGLPGAQAAAATHTIRIEAMQYSPATLRVKRGDEVVWVNDDPFPHTATATDRSFDSKEIAAGRRWRFVAKSAGTHEYSCTYHPTMKATLVVE